MRQSEESPFIKGRMIKGGGWSEITEPMILPPLNTERVPLPKKGFLLKELRKVETFYPRYQQNEYSKVENFKEMRGAIEKPFNLLKQYLEEYLPQCDIFYIVQVPKGEIPIESNDLIPISQVPEETLNNSEEGNAYLLMKEIIPTPYQDLTLEEIEEFKRQVIDFLEKSINLFLASFNGYTQTGYFPDISRSSNFMFGVEADEDGKPKDQPKHLYLIDLYPTYPMNMRDIARYSSSFLSKFGFAQFTQSEQSLILHKLGLDIL